MNFDIGEILRDWPYEHGQVTARRVRGADEREKIQLRLDLGLLQMEATGRPDGQRPHGFEDLTAYHEHRLQSHKDQTGSDRGFKLDERDCELLRGESLMYYHRYLAEFVLEDYHAVERDTMRNLRLMDLCAAYAAEEGDKYVLEQYRPYVLMMCTRSRARLAVNDNRIKGALSILRAGIDRITGFYKRFGQEELGAESGEIAILKAMMKEIESRLPIDPIQRLRNELAKAVKEERYEDAANLRDQLESATDDQKDKKKP